MIDRETQDRIIDLWKEGESKASIHRATNVSLPSIRKIIREAGMEERENEDVSTIDTLNERLTEVEEELDNLKQSVEALTHKQYTKPEECFIVNLTRNYPHRNLTTLQALKYGTPPWILRDLLSEIFPKSIAETIANEIEKLGPKRVYEVKVKHTDHIPDITVFPLTF
jgi:uncharacterized coiled-coil protein SlyX